MSYLWLWVSDWFPTAGYVAGDDGWGSESGAVFGSSGSRGQILWLGQAFGHGQQPRHLNEHVIVHLQHEVGLRTPRLGPPEGRKGLKGEVFVTANKRILIAYSAKLLYYLWWMPNLGSKGFSQTTRTCSSRQLAKMDKSRGIAGLLMTYPINPPIGSALGGPPSKSEQFFARFFWKVAVTFVPRETFQTGSKG